MSQRNKLLRWVSGMANKTQPVRYCTFSDMSSEEDLYEEIENFCAATTTTDGIHQKPGTAEYNQYLREYFFALRDSHINSRRLSKDPSGTTSANGVVPLAMAVDDDGEQCDQYLFSESELYFKNRSRGRYGCLPDRPRICVCSCEVVFRRPVTPPPRTCNVSWDAGWVFRSDKRDMSRLARRSNERLREELFQTSF